MCFCVQARGAISIATRGHCRKATEGWIKQISVFRLSLCCLSRVAGDYFSDSVVCIEILRPLRSLREIKIIAFCFFTQSAQRAQSFIYLSYSTLALEWSQTSLRQECAESLSTPSPLRGYSRLSQGEKVGDGISQL